MFNKLINNKPYTKTCFKSTEGVLDNSITLFEGSKKHKTFLSLQEHTYSKMEGLMQG